MTRRRSAGDRGSALFLFPAAALVVVVLASIAVDFGMLLVRQRELWMVADAAANDAASLALDEAHLRATGEVRLVAERAWEAAAGAVEGSGIQGLRLDAVEVGGDGREVTVTVSLETSLVIGRGLPGDRTRRLTATASARLEDGQPLAP